MIIELFGPPGAGKTTFARTLAARLREHGHTVHLILSHRPAERSAPETSPAPTARPRQVLPAIRRLIRPLAEMLTMARQPLAFSHDVGAAFALIRTMPPSDILWFVRLIQYLTRLSRAWSQSTDTDHIVLFDQAFVQAICSLVLLCGTADELTISHALDKIPQPDLLVLLNAPTEIVEVRLRDRERHASGMERLLELDLATSLKSMTIIDCIQRILRNKGIQIANAASLDQRSLQEAADRIEKQIAARNSRASRKWDPSTHFARIGGSRDPDSYFVGGD
jgi:broad-specificity NMP kinase